jgi:hypothetical protein
MVAASIYTGRTPKGDSSGASQLPVRPSAFNYVMAMSHFARGPDAERVRRRLCVGAAMSKIIIGSAGLTEPGLA